MSDRNDAVEVDTADTGQHAASHAPLDPLPPTSVVSARPKRVRDVRLTRELL
ncbi:hypothetical protein [Mycolicibacterium wolinskyi]|uniref:hypothetical protein n=1 Tax=Mycolicibacterium wolinskyi TaxID=59750 RepID=UPI0039177C1F